MRSVEPTAPIPGIRPVRSHAPWLPLAHLGVISTTILASVFFVVSLPSYFAFVTAPCTAGPCRTDQLLPADVTKLAAMGISLQLYAVCLIALQSTYVLVTMGVVFLLLRRRSAQGFSLFTALTLVAWIFFVVDAPSVLADKSTAWSIVDGLFALGAFVSFTIFCFLFPSGRFAARWARWLAVVLIVVTVVFFAASSHGMGNAPIGAYLALFAVWFGAIIGVQTYRYRNVSTPAERQQTKWVVFALFISLLGFVLLLATQTFADLSNALLSGFYYPFELLIPLSIGIAILRYRLYDIDVIIRRTLIYGSLTASLAALYFGSVVLMQHLAIDLAGAQAADNSLILVVSTLLIAALFTPLRRRIQRTIDHRFYRAKYNAAKTLAAFSATLRTETDLDQLGAHVVSVIDETMQPTHVSLWLRAAPDRRRNV
jgi:hypothetical protein